MTGCVSDADLCREEESLPFVVFCAAGCRFGIEASQIQGSDGFVDASLRTVESLLGLPEDLSGSVRQRLRVRDPESAAAFSVGVPVDLCTFSIREIFPLPPFIAARCRLPALLALVIAPEGLVCLMDVPGLLKARQVQGEILTCPDGDNLSG